MCGNCKDMPPLNIIWVHLPVKCSSSFVDAASNARATAGRQHARTLTRSDKCQQRSHTITRAHSLLRRGTLPPTQQLQGPFFLFKLH